MAAKTKPAPSVKPISPEAPVRPETPPVRVRHRSLIAVTLRAAALRILGGQVGVSDATLSKALESLSQQLDHPAYCMKTAGMPESIEDLLREAVRIGVDAGVEWWTGTADSSPYQDVTYGEQLVARVQADVLPELLTRYYMIKG